MQPPSRSRRRLLALAAAAVAAAGCASSGQERVEVHLAGVALQDATLLEQRLRLTLRFQNRGNADLEVDGLAYRLEANATTIASGVSNRAFVIPRYGETRVDVEATSALTGVLQQVIALQRGSAQPEPRLVYRLHGTANLAPDRMALGRGGSFSFETINELPLPGDPAAPVR